MFFFRHGRITNLLTCVGIHGSETEGIVSHCQIHDGKGTGVLVNENSTGRIDNCDIFGNAKAGIAITKGGNPVVQKCTIKQNSYWAVWVV
ncbi:MAG: right-handed parallel beta-helix repeat-containing protein [Pseudomonadota bacterium]